MAATSSPTDWINKGVSPVQRFPLLLGTQVLWSLSPNRLLPVSFLALHLSLPSQLSLPLILLLTIERSAGLRPRYSLISPHDGVIIRRSKMTLRSISLFVGARGGAGKMTKRFNLSIGLLLSIAGLQSAGAVQAFA